MSRSLAVHNNSQNSRLELERRPGFQNGYSTVNSNHQDIDIEEDGLNSAAVGYYVKSTILGGLDGLSTSFAIIAAAAGGNLSWAVVLILGFAGIFANALAMGIGEYFSSRAHREFVLGEKRRATWEFKHFKSKEISKMALNFESRGMSKADSEIVVTKMANFESFFVNLMVTEELGFRLPEDDEEYLLTDAFVMFLSFFGFGAIPLLVYFLGLINAVNDSSLFIISSSIILVALFGLGAIKSTFSSVSWVYSGLETLAVGCVCAGTAFGVAKLVAQILAH